MESKAQHRWMMIETIKTGKDLLTPKNRRIFPKLNKEKCAKFVLQRHK